MSAVSHLDQVFRSIIISKFFSKGWGSPEKLKKLVQFRKTVANRELCQTLVDPNHEITIDKVEVQEPEVQLVSGHFESPVVKHLPDLLPEASETAYFQMVLPTRWTTTDRPIVIQMAGTGDHFFGRRRTFMARPLLREHGIASLILENPFYGYRKPKEQWRSNLHNVSDIFVMGLGLILEAIALLRWCEREQYGPFCLHGISMGGHMASLAAASWPKPIGLVPCLSWSNTASIAFTQGVMSGAIDWKHLQEQLLSETVYREEIAKMLELDDTDKAYIAGVPGKAHKDSLKFMRELMIEFTHVKRFPVPVDPEMIIVVAARNDAYIPREGTAPIDQVWPGCEVRFIEGGHVSGYFMNHSVFRKSISDAIDRNRKKHHHKDKKMFYPSHTLEPATVQNDQRGSPDGVSPPPQAPPVHPSPAIT